MKTLQKGIVQWPSTFLASRSVFLEVFRQTGEDMEGWFVGRVKP